MTTPADRLQLLYDLAREVTTFAEIDPLLRYATRRTRELLEAEGCALLLLDESRRQFFFPVASQAASQEVTSAALEQITFPADRGVAGWVLQHDQPALVEDAASDPRFYPGVDRQVGSTTRSILCAPLRTPAGNIGVVEVINPLRGRFGAEDLTLLEAIAANIAIACEKARLYERIRREALDLRSVCRVAGLGLAALGFVFGGGGFYAHLALGLPLGELPARPAMLTALLLVGVGGALLAVGRGWLIAATTKPRTICL